jgi:hypothetical protein
VRLAPRAHRLLRKASAKAAGLHSAHLPVPEHQPLRVRAGHLPLCTSRETSVAILWVQAMCTARSSHGQNKGC